MYLQLSFNQAVTHICIIRIGLMTTPMNIICIQLQPRYNSHTMAVLHGVILIGQSFLILQARSAALVKSY